MPYYNRHRKTNDYPTIEITPVKLLSAVIAIMVGFVIPAQIVDQIRLQTSQPAVYTTTQPSQNQQVAGSSTSNLFGLIGQEYQKFTNNKDALMAAGFAMIITSLVICSYLLIRLTQSQPNKARLEYEPIGLFD